MKHYLLTLLLLTMSAMTALGQQTVSVEEAQAKAAAFLNHSAGAKGGTVTTDVQLAYTAQQGNETYYYVFNNGSNGQGGFVIIGGDETARTILGYSDNGAFDPNNMPENMKWWLSQYEQQISAAIKNGGTTAAAKGGMGPKSIARADIDTLCLTLWDQGKPYNAAISGNIGYTFVTGCVATAMAQIMKKYEYPAQGIGSKTYQSETLKNNYTADFGNTTYQWTKMTDAYGNSYSGTAAEDAVATLMYHCGVAAEMDYTITKGSSASSYTAAQGMIDYFNYDKGMSYEKRTYYSDDAWAEMIYAELYAGRPVLYSGSTSLNQGHAFVCDGYKYDGEYDLFHMNWGWSGYCNGYFPLQGTAGTVKALTPNGSGTGGGTAGYAYDQSQSVVIGIQPNKSNKLKLKMQCIAFSIATSGTAGSGIQYSGTFYNTSLQSTDLTIGIRLVNQSTNEETDMEATTWSGVNPNEGYTITNGSVVIPANTPAGTYSAYPIYKNENDTWQKMDSNLEAPTITILAAGEGLVVNGTPTISNGGYVTPNSGIYSISIWNNSSEDINNASFRAIIYYRTTIGENSYQFTPMGFIDATTSFMAGETEDVVFDFKNYNYEYLVGGIPMTAGNTYYIVPTYNNSNLHERISFQCTEKQTISYKLSSAGWGTLCLPFSAAIPDGLTMYEVTGTNGNELVKTSVDKIEINKAYLVSGTPGTYDFSGPTTPMGQHTNGLLVGNTESGDVFVPIGSYVMQNLPSKSGLAFYKVTLTDRQRCSQYKAYLKPSSGLTSLYSALLFTDGTTGIESIDATDEQQDTVRKVLKNGRLTIETPQGSFTPAGARMK